MDKFKSVYNIILSIWKVCSAYKEKELNKKTCDMMYEELNQKSKNYSGAEWKLMANIGTEIMKYLFDENYENK